ncbi:hypothetical protein [Nocardia jejuensis]|uniref:hypothetical protein n=1 Tax=Nocardia jejuensis TaxID=328049 RepID=UPI000A7D60B0|nr:hypothetical protein [Nocardia jejuensis]
MTDSWRNWLPDTDIADSAATIAEHEPFIDDDPLLEIKLAVRDRARTGASRKKFLRTGGAIAAVAALIAGAAIGLTSIQNGDSHAAAPASAATTPATAAPVWCAESRSAAVVVGNGKGRTPGPGVTGPDLILNQQWQWYVARNADASRAVLAADAQAADPELARAAVAAVPAGTKHCVTITALAPEKFDVQIDEKHGDGTSAHWQQTVTTAVQDGRTVITSITAGGAA